MSDKRDRLLLAASFFLPFFLLLGLYALLGIAPLGNHTLLIADAKGQYLSFLALYQNLFAGKADWFYSFEKLLGGPISGLYAYYLASPFHLILLLFPREELPMAVNLVILLKLSACGLTMALYLRSRGMLRPAALFFTTAYAFCGYNNAYAWCIMWVDAVVFLPLVALGIERLWKEQKPLLYVLSLALAIISCFYTGYMLCLFSVLYFLHVALRDTPKLRDFRWKTILRYALASLLAGGISAMLLLPGFLALSGGVPIAPRLLIAKYTYPAALRMLHALLPGHSDYDRLVFPMLMVWLLFTVALAVGIWRLLRRNRKGSDIAALSLGLGSLIAWFVLMEYPICSALCFTEKRFLIKLLLGYVPFWEFYDGSPNLYAGSAAFLLGLGFFANHSIPRRERIAGGLLLLTLLVSACFYLPNLVWHGFEENNCFNFRWSFAFPFVLLTLAARSFDRHEGMVPVWTVSSWLIGVVILLLAAWRPMWFQKNWMLLVCAAFLTLELLLMLFWHRGSKAAERLLCLTGLAAVCLSTGLSFYDQTENGPNCTALRNQIASQSKLYEHVLDTNDSFFRIRKKGVSVNYNDPMLFHYPGLVHFSSSEKVDTIRLLSQMGQIVSPRYWANGDLGESRATDALLNVGRYLGADGCADYEQIEEGIWKNPYMLPLAYLADRNAGGSLELDSNVCSNLNRIFSRLTGRDCEIFLPAESRGLSLTVEREDPVYLRSWSSSITDCTLYCNGESVRRFSDLSYPYLISLGSFRPGDVLTVEVSGKRAIPQMPETVFYYESSETLAACTAELKAGGCETVIHAPSHIEIRTAADEEKLLVVTLPEDKGWSVTVDGEKRSPETVINTLIALPLTAGEHEIVMRYTPPGLHPGAVISAASLLGLLGWEILRRRKEKQCRRSAL